MNKPKCNCGCHGNNRDFLFYKIWDKNCIYSKEFIGEECNAGEPKEDWEEEFEKTNPRATLLNGNLYYREEDVKFLIKQVEKEAYKQGKLQNQLYFHEKYLVRKDTLSSVVEKLESKKLVEVKLSQITRKMYGGDATDEMEERTRDAFNDGIDVSISIIQQMK